jgi:putative ABC transport system permease protein
MGARWRKVRSDVLSNKTRSLLAIASLAVGTMAVGAMQLASTTVDSSFRASFLAANPPSAMLRTDPFPVGLVDEVRANPAVGEAEGRRLIQARTVTPDGEAVNVELVAMSDFDENQVARIEPTEGAWPPAAGAVVVERSSVAELGTGLGEVVSIGVPGRPPIDLRVAGSAFDVYEVTATLGGPARAYVSMDTMTELTGSGDLDTLYLRAARDPLDRDQALTMTAAVRDEVLEPAGVAIRLSAIQEPGEHRGENALSFIVSAMGLLSLLALVIAMALVVNTVTALLAQQRRQVGVMKAIGARSGQLTLQYLGYVLLLSVGALVAAVPLSLLGGRFLAGFMAELANFELEPMGIPWTTLAIEAAIAGLLPVVAVLVAVRRTCRSTVREAISDRGITAVGQRRRIRLPFARPTVLAYRNAVRNRPRLALTVLAIAMCGAVLVGVLSTQKALGRLTDQVAGYWDYDVELTLTEPTSSAAATALLGEDRAVASVEGWIETQAFRIRPDGSENENISLTGAPPGSPSLDPTLIDGRWLDAADDHAIVINNHFADEESDLGVGDEVVLDIEGHRRAWNVVGVSTTTLVGPVAYVPVDDLAAEIDEPGQANLLAVQLRPGADATEAAQRLESAARDAGVPVGDVQTNAQLRSVVDDLVALVAVLLLMVGAVLGLVAVVGVAGTMTLSVVEQTREIGVLRTLGASTWAVRRLLLLQGLAIATAGGVLGVIGSIPIALLLRGAIGDSLISATLPAGFSWPGVAIWVAVALIIGALGATRPARVAARLTIRDTLAYE